MQYEHTYFYKVNTLKSAHAASADEKLRNNVEEKPTFFVMVASDMNLRLIV